MTLKHARTFAAAAVLCLAATGAPAQDDPTSQQKCWTWDRTSGVGQLVDLSVGFVRWLSPFSGCTTGDPPAKPVAHAATPAPSAPVATPADPVAPQNN